MKRIAITLIIVLGIAMGASAQNRGLFGMGPEHGESYGSYDRTSNGGLMLPTSHGTNTDQEGAPLGSGALLFIGFGAAYAMKKRKQQ